MPGDDMSDLRSEVKSFNVRFAHLSSEITSLRDAVSNYQGNVNGLNTDSALLKEGLVRIQTSMEKVLAAQEADRAETLAMLKWIISALAGAVVTMASAILIPMIGAWWG